MCDSVAYPISTLHVYHHGAIHVHAGVEASVLSYLPRKALLCASSDILGEKDGGSFVPSNYSRPMRVSLQLLQPVHSLDLVPPLNQAAYSVHMWLAAAMAPPGRTTPVDIKRWMAFQK